jgi:hypothetical protein
MKLGIKSVERPIQTKTNNSSFLKVNQTGHYRTKSVNPSTMKIPGSTKNSTKFRNSILSTTGKSITKKEPHSGVNSPVQHKFGSSPVVPQRLNGVSQRFFREQNMAQLDQRRKIRLISLIDSKPINHYVTLLTLKEFSKREQDVGGLAGSMQTSAGMKEREHQKNRDVSKILSEDLTDQYYEKIGRRYEQMKAEKKLLQANQI